LLTAKARSPSGRIPAKFRRGEHAISFKDMKKLMSPSTQRSGAFGSRRCPDLILTGSNLSTGRTQIFSEATTPDFPVADAVRISMGLPIFFKPYVITDPPRNKGWPPCGTYVDGGLWNNLPFREFGSDSRDTLGIRLEIVPPEAVTSLLALLGRSLTFGIFGTGETQVLGQYARDQLLLDTDGLALFPFKADPDVLKTVTKRSARAVYNFWSLDIPDEYQDERDEAHSWARRQAAEKCALPEGPQ
jgi:predicted acylesterase/phospholipase RssA